MDSKDFISELKKGKNEAYDKLVDMYSQKIYYLCLKMLGNPSDAEDAVQTTFLKIYKGIKNFEGRSGLSTWIYKIAMNTCNDILRKRKTNFMVPLIAENGENEENIKFDIVDKTENVEDAVLRREREKLIYECIYLLPHGHRKFIVLRDLEGFSYAEIARILDMNIGTVKSGINRARSKLMEILKTHSDNGEF